MEDIDHQYEGHPQLSPLQAQVLEQYDKLNRSIKSLTVLMRDINDSPNDALLSELRALERQMGLVLTLFKASVWSYYRTQGLAGSPSPSSIGGDEDEDSHRSGHNEGAPATDEDASAASADITAMPMPNSYARNR